MSLGEFVGVRIRGQPLLEYNLKRSNGDRMRGFKIPPLGLTTILVLMTFSTVIKEIKASGEFLVILIIAFLLL